MADRSDVVIGVDIGTTSTKAVAFTADAQERASAGAGYELHTPRAGYAEQDPGEVADAAVQAVREAAAQARDAGHRVAGLGFSAAMHALVGLDARGEPLTPVVTWADSRAADQAGRLRGGARGLALHRRTGTPVHPMSPLLKLRWFAETQPEIFEAARHWVGVKELVLRRLTGDLVVDHGVASATGMFNLGDGDWDDEALGYAGVRREQLPELVPTTAELPLGEDGARLTGLPAGTPLIAGAADGPLANLGLGAIRPGTAACSIGTSGAARVVADAPRVDERGRVFCYVLAPGRYVIGGAVNNGGVVLDWLGDAVAPDIAAQGGGSAVLDAAERVPAGSGGVLFLPQLLGERAPHWSGDPRGAYVGLTRAHRREHLLRAAIEGVCLQLSVVLTSLGEAGVDVHEIRATGGFSRSPLWRRILAGAFGRPIGFAASPEGSSLGAALLAMTALGMLDSLDRAAELVEVTGIERPDRGEAELYARLQPIFEAAYESLGGVSRALAGMTELAPEPVETQ